MKIEAACPEPAQLLAKSQKSLAKRILDEPRVTGGSRGCGAAAAGPEPVTHEEPRTRSRRHPSAARESRGDAACMHSPLSSSQPRSLPTKSGVRVFALVDIPDCSDRSTTEPPVVTDTALPGPHLRDTWQRTAEAWLCFPSVSRGHSHPVGLVRGLRQGKTAKSRCRLTPARESVAGKFWVVFLLR